TPGESRQLRLELKVLADVGLLGMPNAGKSTLIRAVTAAKAKVADYPFTTLVPQLGVVKVDRYRSFVMADIPGLIEGASEGTGLGIRFLKHLARTHLLLHVVDVEPVDNSDPVENVQILEEELERFSPSLAQQPRWLVLNKLDLIPEEMQDEVCEDIVKRLAWEGPVYRISAATKSGTQALAYALMNDIEERRRREEDDPEYAAEQEELRAQLEEEARERVQQDKLQRRLARQNDDDDEDDDQHDMKIMYSPYTQGLNMTAEPQTQRGIIKIGGSLLTNDEEGLDIPLMQRWVDQMVALREQGIEIVVVSSGAVAEGMGRLGWKE